MPACPAPSGDGSLRERKRFKRISAGGPQTRCIADLLVFHVYGRIAPDDGEWPDGRGGWVTERLQSRTIRLKQATMGRYHALRDGFVTAGGVG